MIVVLLHRALCVVFCNLSGLKLQLELMQLESALNNAALVCCAMGLL